MEWISVEERLPEEGQEVIYFFKHTGIHVGKFHRKFIKELNHTFNCFSGSEGFLFARRLGWRIYERRRT